MRIGVQGEAGSACDAAVSKLLADTVERIYLTDGERTIQAVHSGEVQYAVVALESPRGTPVDETSSALQKYPCRITRRHEEEVRHCVMTLGHTGAAITQIASHPIPLRKHKEFLEVRFPEAHFVTVADTGLAAQMLHQGAFPPTTAVIALPYAAELFGLTIIETDLPANDNYLTVFGLIER
jgi:prephenate dehydratase